MGGTPIAGWSIREKSDIKWMTGGTPTTWETSMTCFKKIQKHHSHRIHGAAIYGNMDPINIPPMLAYIPYMDPMGLYVHSRIASLSPQ